MTGTQAPRRAARPQRGGRRAVRRRRRSSRRPLILLLAIVLVAGVLVYFLVSPGGRPSTGAGGGRTASTPITKITASLVPHIAQTGVRPASADRATGLVQVQAATKKAGAHVTLQVRRDRTWVDTTTLPLAKDGQATFETPSAPADADRLLRVVASTDRTVHSAPVHPDAWKVAFEDQFDGYSLDTSKWSYRQLGLLNPGRTKAESSTDAVRVENGALKLGMLENPARPGYYLNGHISTEQSFSFTYGVAAARVKFQKPRGMHGAFWLQAPSFGAVPGDAKQSGSEIDAVEYFGSTYPDGGLASFTYYRDKDGNSAKTGGLQTDATDALEHGDAWWKKYHVFSVEWTPDAYVIRIDGRETYRQTENISGVPEFMVLSLLSSDWELPDLDRTQIPTDMKVDWVRVYQQQPPQQ
jgi:beta-glucanase (GH16 family)